MSEAVMKGLRVSPGLRPQGELNRGDLSQIEKRASLWFNLLNRNLPPHPDPAFSRNITEILYESPLYGMKLNIMKFITTVNIRSKPVIENENRLILGHLCRMEMGVFDQSARFLRSPFGKDVQAKPIDVLASIWCLPTRKMPMREVVYHPRVLLLTDIENPSKDFEEKVQLFIKARIALELTLKDLEGVKGVADRVSLLRGIADKWLQVERIYGELVKLKSPEAYFALQKAIAAFSEKEFLDICQALNGYLIEINYSKYDELVCAQDLFLSVADAFFNTVREEVDLSCEFIQAMESRTQVRSKYFTPLDVFRIWWMDVYLKSNLEKARMTIPKISDIFIILRYFAGGKGVKNILFKDLSYIMTKLKEIEDVNEHRYALEPFQLMKKLVDGRTFPTLLLHWLDAPLLHIPENELSQAEEARLFGEIETHWHLRRSSSKICAIDQNKASKYFKLSQRVHQGDFSCSGLFEGTTTIKDKASNVALYFQNEITFIGAMKFAEKYASVLNLTEKDVYNTIVNYQTAFSVYLYPLYKYGIEVLEEIHPLEQMEQQFRFSKEAFLEAFKAKKLNPDQMRNLKELGMLIEVPIFPYAIYQKMAQTLEAFNNSNRSHSLKGLLLNEDPVLSTFLEKMEGFLPNRPFKPSISLEQFPVDMENFCKVLGVPGCKVPSSQKELSARSDRTEEMRTQFAAFENRIKYTKDTYFQDVKNQDILDVMMETNKMVKALPALFHDLDKLLALLDDREMTGPEMGYFLFTVGRIIEYGMKLIVTTKYDKDLTAVKAIQIHDRKLLFSHQVYAIYSQLQDMMPILSQQEVSELASWDLYSNVARYPKRKNGTLFDRYVMEGLPEEERASFKQKMDLLLSIAEKLMGKLNSC